MLVNRRLNRPNSRSLMTASRALAVVVDHPPQIAHVVLPAFEERLVDVALVELRVPDDRHHPPAPPVRPEPLVRIEVVLHQRRERRHRDPEPDRAGGDVHVVGVLGARRIGLHPAERAEALELLPGLPAEQVLDGVEHRARVRLHRDAGPTGGARPCRARSSGSPPTPSLPGGPRPSVRRRSAGRGWRGESSTSRARGIRRSSARSIVMRSGPAMRNGVSRSISEWASGWFIGARSSSLLQVSLFRRRAKCAFDSAGKNGNCAIKFL